MAVDLHLHSTASDGTLTPEQVVGRASELGLSAIGIADHDTLAGVPSALAAAPPGLDVFPAVEMSAALNGREVHILGYLVDGDHPELSAALERVRQGRRERTQAMLERLQSLGVPITPEDLAAVSDTESPGRPHVAAALVALGVVRDPKEAFQRFLGRGRPAYVDRYRVPADQAIQLILEARGLPALAHPGLVADESIIPELVAQGLQGLEAYHVEHTPGQVARYRDMAEQLGLLVVGGSDSHGPAGPTPVEIGSVKVPDECAQALRKWGEQRGRWPWVR